MIKRKSISAILESLDNFPIIGLIGSRQVGKTTLSKQIAKIIKKKSIYLDLELPSDVNKLRSPELYLKEHEDKVVIIDEIQRMPELFPLLRALVDQKNQNGRFLLLGSASPDIIRNTSESLAGRIVYHTLNPFSLEEIELSDMKKLWVRGGYPDSFLASNDEISFKWREAFLKTHLERDLPQLGIGIPALQLYRFLMMLSHLHGQLLNVNKLASSMDLSGPTIQSYLDIFENTFMIRRLYPYFINLKKRLIKSPKIYIHDSGILHALLQINDFEELQSHPTLGSSWEGFVIEQIYALMTSGWQISFYRTNAGAEIDLILRKANQAPIAIEIKYSLSPVVSKGFWSGFNDLGCKKGFIIYPGKDSYPVKENVQVLSIFNLSNIFN